MIFRGASHVFVAGAMDGFWITFFRMIFVLIVSGSTLGGVSTICARRVPSVFAAMTFIACVSMATELTAVSGFCTTFFLRGLGLIGACCSCYGATIGLVADAKFSSVATRPTGFTIFDLVLVFFTAGADSLICT